MPGASNQVISGDIPSKLNHLNIAVSLFLQVSLVSLFLGVFYFTYVDKIEEDIVTQQVTDIVADFTSSATYFMSPAALNQAKQYAATLQPPDMASQDADTEAKNVWLERQGLVVLSTIALCGFLFFVGHAIFVYKAGYAREAGYVFIESIIMLCAIALTEFCFLTFISRQFMTADPNVIRQAIAMKLLQFQQQNPYYPVPPIPSYPVPRPHL